MKQIDKSKYMYLKPVHCSVGPVSTREENINNESKVVFADHIARLLSDNVELVEAGAVSDSFSTIHSGLAKKPASPEKERQLVCRKY